MTSRSLSLLLLFALLLPLPARAEKPTYQWRDRNGVIHFTDNSDSIPDQYLRSVKELPPVSAEPKQEPKAQAKTEPTDASQAASTKTATAAAGESKTQVTSEAKSEAKSGGNGAAATAPSDLAAGSKEAQKAALSQQLEKLRKELSKKEDELARLRHRWAVAKGRTPTAKELKDYEEKKKKGKATAMDNPYVNKSALSTPAPRRAAYYKKLEEIKQDQGLISKLEAELEAL
jgi:hypothetical protein